MTRDRYATMHPHWVRTKHPSWESMRQHVLSLWPGAWAEGSVGPERTWWVGRSKDDCIAHCWPVGRARTGQTEERWWVRVCPPT